MSVLPAAIMGASSILGGALSSGDSKGATYLPSTYYMDPTLKAAYENAFLQAMNMPSSLPISYGGESYAIPNQWPAQAAAMYAQSLNPVMTQTATPSPLSGAMTALAGVMPYLSGSTGIPELLPYTQQYPSASQYFNLPW